VLEDKDAVVVQVKLHKVEAATSTLPGEGTAEPEVITAKKKVDETEE
jgi:hypothetical protein